MKYPIKDRLSDQEVESGLKAVIKDGLATQAMVTFTGGPFLVAFALKLGASNVIIGLLAAIPPLAHLIQIPSIYLVEKIRRRRTISVGASSLSRILWLFIASIPFLFSPKAGLVFLTVALLFISSLAAIGGCSWNSWMRDLVPQDRLGAFFSKRMSLAVALGLVLTLMAGIYIDVWKRAFPTQELYGYSILFLLGFVSGIIGVYFISTIPEPRMTPAQGRLRMLRIISQPFSDSNFRNLIKFSGAWNFAVNLAAPFFTVYMLQRLGLEMSYVIALAVLTQITNMTFLRIWGQFADRFSNKSVLGVSGPLFMVSIFAWTFTTLPEKHLLTVPLLITIHVLMGISTAGVNLASGTIGLKLASKGQSTAYLGTYTLVNSLTAGFAPIIGGQFADFFAGRELSLKFNWLSPGGELTFQTLNFQQWDFFFFFAFLVGLYSIHRLALVQEIGEVEKGVVLRELTSEVKSKMRNLSTAAGLRQLIQFPFSILRNLK